MRKRLLALSLIAIVIVGLLLSTVMSGLAHTKNPPIVIGAPLSTQYLYGWDAQRAMVLAVQEINAKGGVTVGNQRRPLSEAVEGFENSDATHCGDF
jgi:branched-chain amino acid transport system substrate-binding protein